MKRVLRTAIAGAVILCVVAIALTAVGSHAASRDVTVTPQERAVLHANAEAYRQTLIDVMSQGITFDTISRGSSGSGHVEPGYDYLMPNFNDPTEYARKTAKFMWAEQLANDLGFPVVFREDGNYVYAEFGDPDAPEMVMALSHLDSPTASVSTANLPRWTTSPWTPRIEDGWLYGCGVQDDSGPTLATLIGAKAIMDAGFPMDRRIRVMMGGYEDGSPRTSQSSGYWEVWRYKQTQEIPVGSYTSDSRFPLIYGTSGSANRTFTYNLGADQNANWELLAVAQDVSSITPRNIIYGSGNQIPSMVTFSLRLPSDDSTRMAFEEKIYLAAASQGWQVKIDTNRMASPPLSNLTVEGVATEAPTPHYGKNAVVRMMSLLSQALPNGMALKKIATDITELLGQDAFGVEDTRGVAMGASGFHPLTGWPMLTVALGYNGGGGSGTWQSLFNPSTRVFSAVLFIRHLYEDNATRDVKFATLESAWTSRGWTRTGSASNGTTSLYTRADSPLIDLLYKSYLNSMQDTEGFDPRPLAYPQGTTGGTFASEFFDKMVAFGAVVPGSERWWHAPDERILIEDAVRQTKFYADGFLELARYSGPAGAKPLPVDIPGLTTMANRLLLDVTIGTYEDASALVPAPADDSVVMAATRFDIPILKQARTSNPSAPDVYSGAIYLEIATADPSATYALPQKIELKAPKSAFPETVWPTIKGLSTAQILRLFSINVLQGAVVTRLADLVPTGVDPESLFFSRKTKDAVYLGVRLALKDSEGLDASVAQASDGSSFFLLGDGTRDARFTSPTALFLTSSPTRWAQEAQLAAVTKLLGNYRNKNRQEPLVNKLDAVIAAVEAGLYAQALGQLEHDILGKTDGCAGAGAPDNNDWITTCESQGELYPLIVEAIDLLRRLMS